MVLINRAREAKITQEHVRDLLDYDKETGEFRWRLKTSKRTNVGDVAGSINSGGYRIISIGYHKYQAHRLAWVYEHGEFPPDLIDHINGDRSDNRLVNLRLATHNQNMRNRSKRKPASGYPGVCLERGCGKYSAKVSVAGRRHYLGVYKTAELANQACEAFRQARNVA